MSGRRAAGALLILLVAALIVAAPAAAAETEVLGNNVSVPAVFAEGYNTAGGALAYPSGSGFRSMPLVDNFDSLTTYQPYFFAGVDGLDLAGNTLLSNWFYEQKAEATWQADWRDGSGAPVQVTRLDWGDSLLSKAWPARAKVRLEVRLYLPNTDGLLGYGMNHLAGTGITEVWGAADAAPIGATAASGEPYTVTPEWITAYSNCARLSLYKIDRLGGNVIGGELFDGDGLAAADKYGDDGPGGFAAEVNVGGYVLYGYTLDGKAMKLQPGFYRVLFSLDASAAWTGGSVVRNTVITGLDPIDSIRDGATETEWPFKSEMNVDGTASWVDIQLLASSGGGGKK